MIDFAPVELPYDLRLGDCREVMATMPEASVDAIVTDPPYGLAFMGKDWDHGVPGVEFWREALRALKPGGHLLAFGGTRTYHRMACAIEDAGFEIRDCIMWVYGSGFPKSHDVGKAIDRAAGAEREVVSGHWRTDERGGNHHALKEEPGRVFHTVTAPATPEAEQWHGWGSALKPAYEPIVVARKPLDGTLAQNVLRHGVGGLNIDGCRVGTGGQRLWEHSRGMGFSGGTDNGPCPSAPSTSGRWPANLCHDGSDEVVELFPHSTSVGGSGPASRGYKSDGRTVAASCAATGGYGDTGSAARFFYCAKATRRERDAGCEGLPRNLHPTVKPIALMRWLVRLVTPPGATVLDPFMGSGTTGCAVMAEGGDRRFVGIEQDAGYLDIAHRRIAHWCQPATDTPDQMTLEACDA